MPDLGLRLGIGAAFAAWFWLIYGVANWWTGLQVDLPSGQLAMDAWIPFVPQVAWVYLTVSIILVLPLIVLPTPAVVALALVLSVEVALAGIAFFIWPVAASAHPAVEVPSIFALADAMNLTYNSAPSLHVAMSLTCAGVLMRHSSGAVAGAIGLWALAIVLSTLLAHQHYIIDVVTGAVLAGFGLLIYPALSLRVKKSAISRRISGM